MTFHYDREIFFDYVRPLLFAGSMTQSQVEGMSAILDAAESIQLDDNRWLGYMLATTYHETAGTMQPIEEYGKGAGMAYGTPDPTTGQTYYGRGYVQLTWRDNYARADKALKLVDADSCEWHAQNALDEDIAARIMYFGMSEGWFRSDGKGPQTLERYFNDATDDPYGAREIINGDKHLVPSWSNGESIGELISGYYMSFTAAINAARKEDVEPAPRPPVPEPGGLTVTTIKVFSRGPVRVVIDET